MNGILTTYNKFKDILYRDSQKEKKSKWKLYTSYKDNISRFHDKVMKALQTGEFISFVNTPTVKLFKTLADNVKALDVVTPAEYSDEPVPTKVKLNSNLTA